MPDPGSTGCRPGSLIGQQQPNNPLRTMHAHQRNVILKSLRIQLRVWMAGLLSGRDDAFAHVERIEQRIREMGAAA